MHDFARFSPLNRILFLTRFVLHFFISMRMLSFCRRLQHTRPENERSVSVWKGRSLVIKSLVSSFRMSFIFSKICYVMSYIILRKNLISSCFSLDSSPPDKQQYHSFPLALLRKRVSFSAENDQRLCLWKSPLFRKAVKHILIITKVELFYNKPIYFKHTAIPFSWLRKVVKAEKT